MAPFAKSLILMGLVIAALGAMLWLFSGVPFVGRLPGDIYVRRGNFTFYFPIVTCILISIVVEPDLCAAEALNHGRGHPGNRAAARRDEAPPPRADRGRGCGDHAGRVRVRADRAAAAYQAYLARLQPRGHQSLQSQLPAARPVALPGGKKSRQGDVRAAARTDRIEIPDAPGVRIYRGRDGAERVSALRFGRVSPRQCR